VTPLTRRDVLRLLGAGAVGSAVPMPIGQQPSATFVPDVDLRLTAAPGRVQILPGQATSVWQFTGSVIRGPADSLQPMPGSYLGPTLRLRHGQRVRIRFRNELSEPSIVHWHGLDVPEAADGHPHRAIAGGEEYVSEFRVTNRAGTYWYHPHPHGRTGEQVYRGLAGLLLVTDDEERALQLPAGQRELLCVLQDRRFDADNQLTYVGPGMMDRMHGLLGQRLLVNGHLTPTIPVDRGPYRLRLLNGSSARIYKLAWSDGTPLTILGSEGGLLAAPRPQRHLTLAPAQRADVFLDLSGRAVGERLELRTAPYSPNEVDQTMAPMMSGATANGMDAGLMTLEIGPGTRSPASLPRVLSESAARWRPRASAPVRQLPISFARAQWLLGGRSFEMLSTAPDEEVRAGSTHIWEVTNASGMMGLPMAHPLHLHGRPFRILSREPAAGAAGSPSVREGLLDDGWLDTVLVLPNERIRLEVTFTEHPGLYLYHCHILEHEDMGMMRNFRVLPA
jgi:FtsP/CotA-like multicopper oxidase with cupredoxin domain